MKSKILSFNIGDPRMMEWNGKSVKSSMHKLPVEGPLLVHQNYIESNSFASPQFHGTPYAVLYIYGMSSALKFAERLSLKNYTPGATGETITVDHFDETQISVGDVFEIGEVVAQATFPRIPCGKVNFRMQHPEGQKAMQDCGLSGVYMRILTPGKIYKTDEVKRVERAKHQYLISDVYQHVVKKIDPTPAQLQTMVANGAFPQDKLDKWAKKEKS